MIGHRKCGVCDELGHKKDMVFGFINNQGNIYLGRYYGLSDWYHPACIKHKRCGCGSGWVKKEPSKERKKK